MGQKWSSFLKRRIFKDFSKEKRRESSEERPVERMTRRETIEKFLRKQGYLYDGDFLEFTNTEPTDERSRIVNRECHAKEYISHIEHVRIMKK